MTPVLPLTDGTVGSNCLGKPMALLLDLSIMKALARRTGGSMFEVVRNVGGLLKSIPLVLSLAAQFRDQLQQKF